MDPELLAVRMASSFRFSFFVCRIFVLVAFFSSLLLSFIHSFIHSHVSSDGYLTTLPASAQDRAELLHEARCFHVQGLIGIIEACNPQHNANSTNSNNGSDAMSSDRLTSMREIGLYCLV
jgi:hypothetical protein